MEFHTLGAYSRNSITHTQVHYLYRMEQQNQAKICKITPLHKLAINAILCIHDMVDFQTRGHEYDVEEFENFCWIRRRLGF